MTVRLRNEYGDLLRAVGNYLDAQGFRNITIIEIEDGMFLSGQVLVASDRGTHHSIESYLFTTDDLEAALEVAYARRGTGTLPRVSDALRYEDILRVIGSRIDAEGWRNIAVFQEPGIVHLKAYKIANVVTRSYTDEELQTLLAQLPSDRTPVLGEASSHSPDVPRRRWPFD
jgi:hypothetical protein